MTQNVQTRAKGQSPTLTLTQRVPADWHRDRPAYEGDPFMDWESGPEPPREPRMVLAEGSATRKVHH